ncbi:hypothetical protein MJH54_35060, partial [Salmonella enterica subsp. enterica serovar Montevideo]|nr:hypothetical protein [Salmonella enterica subsp. enterica serovar Montevideo]
ITGLIQQNACTVKTDSVLIEVTLQNEFASLFTAAGQTAGDKGHLEPVQGKQKVEDGLGDLNKPLSNQNLVTWKDTPVYNAP